MHHTRPKPAIFLVLLVGVLSISTAAILIRYAQSEADSLVIAAARMLLSVVPLIPVAFLRYRKQLFSLPYRSVALSVLSGTFLALHFAAWITSLEHTSIASSVVLVCTTPIWVTLFGTVIQKEATSRAVISGIIIATLGGLAVGIDGICTLTPGGLTCALPESMIGRSSTYGNILALFGAWMAAGYLLAGRKARGDVDLVPYAFISYSVAAMILVAIVAALKLPVTGFSHETYLYFVLLGLIPQLIGHTSLNWALKYLPTTYVSIAQMGEPVGSTILGMLLLNEYPTPIKIMGGILILVGIYTVTATVKTKEQISPVSSG